MVVNFMFVIRLQRVLTLVLENSERNGIQLCTHYKYNVTGAQCYLIPRHKYLKHVVETNFLIVLL